MLKFFPIFIVCFCISAFALVFEDSSSNTLTPEQKQEIFDLFAEHKDKISKNRVKLGIISDVKPNEPTQTVHLIKSYIVDSLDFNKNVILEKTFHWTPSLDFPLKNVRPKIVELIPVTNFFQSSLIMLIDSLNAEVSGDTITTGKGGFALIRYNNNHRITLHENTEIVLSHSQVSLLKGNLSISQSGRIFANQYIMPLKIITDKNDFEISGNAFVSVNKVSIAQIFEGSAVSKIAGRSDTIRAGYAISIASSTDIIINPIPQAPLMFGESNFAKLPGDLIKFRRIDDFEQRIIVADAENHIIVDTIFDAEAIELNLPFGELKFFAQNIDTAGIISAWSQKNIKISRLDGLKSIEIFDDTLFYQTDDRPFTYRGIADPSVRIFIDNEEVKISENGEFSKKVMLNDSLNYPEIIILYKDLSGDTLLPTIFYTLWDERIEMNDSIMGKPAFTASRTYKWRGVAPTATKIRINNEEIEIKEGGKFEKTIKAKAFTTYPVLIDVIYENTNQKTFTKTLTRERYASSGELRVREGLLVVLATAIITGMAVIAITGNTLGE